MRMDQIVRRLKLDKRLKKIYKRINTKFSLAKRKNPKCTNRKKGITFKPSEAIEKIPRRKITSAGCSFVNNLKSAIRKNGNL